MPKKLNKAGNEQEYIAAGNGDASGEYANDSGSNRHFTNFAKPQDNASGKSYFSKENQKEATDYLLSQIKENDERRKKEKKGFIFPFDYNKVDALHNSDVVKKKDSLVKIANAYKKQAEKGNPYIIAQGLGTSFYFSGTKTGESGIVIRTGTFDSNGETWFHENGHLLDNTFENENGRGNYSSQYKSKKYNKTLKESLDEEFETYFTKERKQEIIDKIEKTREAVYALNGVDLKEYEQQKKMLLDYQKPLKQELKKKYAEIEQEYKDGKIEGWTYLSKRYAAKNWYQQETANSTARIYNLLPKKKKENIEMQVAKEVYRKYSSITDMYSSLGKGRLHPEYGGYHDKDYWKKEDSKRVKEFFADAFSGYTLEDERYKELINAFPKSIEIFEEIYNQID